MKDQMGSDRPQKTVVTNQFLDFHTLLLSFKSEALYKSPTRTKHHHFYINPPSFYSPLLSSPTKILCSKNHGNRHGLPHRCNPQHTLF